MYIWGKSEEAIYIYTNIYDYISYNLYETWKFKSMKHIYTLYVAYMTATTMGGSISSEQRLSKL